MDRGQRAEAVRDAVVGLVLELRGEALAAGMSPLTHWDQLHDRMLVAARSSESIETFVTTTRRGLRLGVPSSGSSAAAVTLAEAADADAQEAIELIESEIGLVFARARLEAERRKEARELARESGGR